MISEARPVSRAFLIASAAPCVLYLGCAIVNVSTGCLFFFNEAGLYRQGPLILATYLVFYFYCIACFALVMLTRAPIDPTIKKILAVFPLVATGVIAVQQLFPSYLLSGSAAACSLLIIYLYLQNKRLSVDLLTGAPNRSEFLSMVSLLHGKQQAFSATLISLSNFKFINDKFGHENGDLFLKEFARYLQEFGDGTSLYRYSGDQFVLVVYEDGEQPDAGNDRTSAMLSELHRRLEHPWSIDGHSYTMTAAIGTVSYPAIARDPKDVVAAIEYATTQAKKSGPNEACICTPAMIDAIHRRSDIADIVRKAIARKSFVVNYQPIWSAEYGGFATAEALCRLKDDKLGSIPPDEFIPIAEETGLISDVTNIVLDQACEFVASYRKAHPSTIFRGVSVNFSPVQFMRDNPAEAVLAAIARHDIPASCIRIEITEGTIVSNPDGVRTFMNAMHEQGVRFYLDDFGTGYSNISTMLELPFDVIKLDKSILYSTSRDSGQAMLLGHLIAGFASVGMQTLAEGVETQEQRDHLARCGCILMQGYLFSRPLPSDEAAKLIDLYDEASTLTSA